MLTFVILSAASKSFSARKISPIERSLTMVFLSSCTTNSSSAASFSSPALPSLWHQLTLQALSRSPCSCLKLTKANFTDNTTNREYFFRNLRNGIFAFSQSQYFQMFSCFKPAKCTLENCLVNRPAVLREELLSQLCSSVTGRCPITQRALSLLGLCRLLHMKSKLDQVLCLCSSAFVSKCCLEGGHWTKITLEGNRAGIKDAEFCGNCWKLSVNHYHIYSIFALPSGHEYF